MTITFIITIYFIISIDINSCSDKYDKIQSVQFSHTILKNLLVSV